MRQNEPPKSPTCWWVRDMGVRVVPRSMTSRRSPGHFFDVTNVRPYVAESVTTFSVHIPLSSDCHRHALRRWLLAASPLVPGFLQSSLLGQAARRQIGSRGRRFSLDHPKGAREVDCRPPVVPVGSLRSCRIPLPDRSQRAESSRQGAQGIRERAAHKRIVKNDLTRFFPRKIESSHHI
jgi:hypothetical protein